MSRLNFDFVRTWSQDYDNTTSRHDYCIILVDYLRPDRSKWTKRNRWKEVNLFLSCALIIRSLFLFREGVPPGWWKEISKLRDVKYQSYPNYHHHFYVIMTSSFSFSKDFYNVHLRPNIWLIAADSFKVHSAWTTGRCSWNVQILASWTYRVVFLTVSP